MRCAAAQAQAVSSSHRAPARPAPHLPGWLQHTGPPSSRRSCTCSARRRLQPWPGRTGLGSLASGRHRVTRRCPAPPSQLAAGPNPGQRRAQRKPPARHTNRHACADGITPGVSPSRASGRAVLPLARRRLADACWEQGLARRDAVAVEGQKVGFLRTGARRRVDGLQNGRRGVPVGLGQTCLARHSPPAKCTSG